MKEKYQHIKKVKNVIVEEKDGYIHIYILLDTVKYDIKLMDELFDISNVIEAENPDKQFSFAHIPGVGNLTGKECVEKWKETMNDILL